MTIIISCNNSYIKTTKKFLLFWIDYVTYALSFM